MRRDGGVGDSPVATGDGGMPNIAAMILTGARHSEEEDARTTAWKDGASALGSASGRCQVDRRVRACRADAFNDKLSHGWHIARGLERPRFEIGRMGGGRLRLRQRSTVTQAKCF